LEAALALLRTAEEGRIAGVIPQSVVFEIAYVLQSQYGLTSRQAAAVVDAVTKFPGMQIVNDCPWKRVLELWPDRLSGLTDAAIVALATTNRYDAVATFDRKLGNKLDAFGLESYF
jgi:predicted nucleic acid-binding protein